MPPKLKSFLKFIGYIAASILGTIIVLITSAVILWNNYNNEIYYKEKFDEEKWKTSEFTTIKDSKKIINLSCTRGEMSKDLINNYLSGSIKKKEVRALIGMPSSNIEYQKFFYKYKCDSYFLGLCNWAGPGKNLIICYESNDIVKDVDLVDEDDASIIILNKEEFQ